MKFLTNKNKNENRMESTRGQKNNLEKSKLIQKDTSQNQQLSRKWISDFKDRTGEMYKNFPGAFIIHWRYLYLYNFTVNFINFRNQKCFLIF